MKSLLLGAVVAVAWLVWWLPTIVWRLARVGAVEARFLVEMATADVLAFIGRNRAARRLLAGVILRNRRLLRAERDRAARRRMQGQR